MKKAGPQFQFLQCPLRLYCQTIDHILLAQYLLHEAENSMKAGQHDICTLANPITMGVHRHTPLLVYYIKTRFRSSRFNGASAKDWRPPTLKPCTHIHMHKHDVLPTRGSNLRRRMKVHQKCGFQAYAAVPRQF